MKLKQTLAIYSYVFIITIAMLPSSSNIKKIEKFETILPSISNITTSDSNSKNKSQSNIKYTFKIQKLLNSIF